MEEKEYNILELFDFPERTLFTTTYEDDYANTTMDVWVEKGQLCFEDDAKEYDDNKAHITKEWLTSKFRKKD